MDFLMILSDLLFTNFPTCCLHPKVIKTSSLSLASEISQKLMSAIRKKWALPNARPDVLTFDQTWSPFVLKLVKLGQKRDCLVVVGQTGVLRAQPCLELPRRNYSVKISLLNKIGLKLI